MPCGLPWEALFRTISGNIHIRTAGDRPYRSRDVIRLRGHSPPIDGGVSDVGVPLLGQASGTVHCPLFRAKAEVARTPFNVVWYHRRGLRCAAIFLATVDFKVSLRGPFVYRKTNKRPRRDVVDLDIRVSKSDNLRGQSGQLSHELPDRLRIGRTSPLIVRTGLGTFSS
jgi:hypothetical protein